MSIHDPFGRLQKRQEREYQSLILTLKEAGIHTQSEAEQLIEKLGLRCQRGVLIVIAISLLITIVLPEFSVFTVSFGVLASVWLITFTKRSKRYIKRYITEEMDNSSEPLD
mgnify:CR=1 FL=1